MRMQQPENQSAKPRLGRSQASTSTSDTGSEKAPPPSYDVAMAQRGEFDGVEVEKGMHPQPSARFASATAPPRLSSGSPSAAHFRPTEIDQPAPDSQPRKTSCRSSKCGRSKCGSSSSSRCGSSKSWGSGSSKPASPVDSLLHALTYTRNEAARSLSEAALDVKRELTHAAGEVQHSLSDARSEVQRGLDDARGEVQRGLGRGAGQGQRGWGGGRRDVFASVPMAGSPVTR